MNLDINNLSKATLQKVDDYIESVEKQIKNGIRPEHTVLEGLLLVLDIKKHIFYKTATMLETLENADALKKDQKKIYEVFKKVEPLRSSIRSIFTSGGLITAKLNSLIKEFFKEHNLDPEKEQERCFSLLNDLIEKCNMNRHQFCELVRRAKKMSNVKLEGDKVLKEFHSLVCNIPTFKPITKTGTPVFNPIHKYNLKEEPLNLSAFTATFSKKNSTNKTEILGLVDKMNLKDLQDLSTYLAMAIKRMDRDNSTQLKLPVDITVEKIKKTISVASGIFGCLTRKDAFYKTMSFDQILNKIAKDSGNDIKLIETWFSKSIKMNKEKNFVDNVYKEYFNVLQQISSKVSELAIDNQYS